MAAHAAAEKVRCIKLSIMGGLELSIMDGLESASDISGGAGGAAKRPDCACTGMISDFNRRRFTLDGGIARDPPFRSISPNTASCNSLRSGSDRV